MKRILPSLVALALPLFLAGCNEQGTTGACSDSFIKTNKDYETDQLGIYTTRDPAFANGPYELGQGDCAELASHIDVTVAEDGNSVVILSDGKEFPGIWSDDDKSFSIVKSPTLNCLLALTKDAARCLKGATYFCDSPCENAYTSPP
ncbi:MAG TPA: hypothetical protein VFX30_11790 [bacterium]|nr:hypothetical protein [bacterium]